MEYHNFIIRTCIAGKRKVTAIIEWPTYVTIFQFKNHHPAGQQKTMF